MIDTTGIRQIDVLYRVSTRAQEAEGESLYNQRREVEQKWAEPRGIKVRRRVEVAESGKSALRLQGGAFVFNRRAQYTELIEEYQRMQASERPDAVVIDWADRWSRNVLEYSGLISAFRVLAIRLIAVGDQLDLTDPRNDLVAHVRAAIGQEQLRITREKVSEARRSRRERLKWQGGSSPDGYRTHDPACPGLKTLVKETPDGRKHEVRVRACDCPQTVLRIDPDREPAIRFILRLIAESSLTWEGMTAEVNAKGFVRPNGTPYEWHDLWRIGLNPHYAGMVRYDLYERDESGMPRRTQRLEEQSINAAPETIPEPYIAPESFWETYRRRYNKQTRYRRRTKNGTSSELTGLVKCPECGKIMSSFYLMSPKTTGHGNPRLSPRKYYYHLRCAAASRKFQPTCGNRQSIRVDRFSRNLARMVSEMLAMSDQAIVAALKLRSSQGSIRALEAERKRLAKEVETADKARHALVKLVASGAMTQPEAEADLFEHRREKAAAETRVREIDIELSRQHVKPDFARARETVTWLVDRWDDLSMDLRAETIRLLVTTITYTPNGTKYPDVIHIEEYGRALVDPAVPARSVGASESFRRSVRS